MANLEDDMDKPVTKRELHDALGIWGGALEARFDVKLDKLEAKVDKLETKVDKLEAKVDVLATNMATKADLRALGDQLAAEFAQHADRILDTAREVSGAVDEKYNDLPPRVVRLENKVFPPRRQRRR